MNPLPTASEMEQAVTTSDTSYDGIFLVAVRTTGIFCRPSCPARKPLPRNREYYSTAQEALLAGYRPCKRCRPCDTDGRPPEWVARLLADVDSDPAVRWRDAELKVRGIDPIRARRYFRAHFGMTFQAYCRQRRLGEALHHLRNGDALDDVALGSGYESHSGFREAFARTFGQPPGRGRQAGCVVTDWIASPLGPLLLAATDQGICLLEFTDRHLLAQQIARLRRHFPVAIVPGKHPALDQLKDELDEYFTGKRREFQAPLVYPGTSFQEAVWQQLLRIPYGETRSYEEVARALGRPGAQRAVGHANGQNRVCILIPCHRVVNKGGQLGGYGGGLWRKQFLLDLERRGNSEILKATLGIQSPLPE